MRKYLVIILLTFTVFFAGLIRFYQLDAIPVSLYWDEVGIGYNAYSIAITGKDEYGYSYPLLFKSYNDYKASGYIYLTALIIPLLGLTEFAIRFWSAFLGTVTVLLSYFLAKEILTQALDEKKTKKDLYAFFAKNHGFFGVLTAFLLAISPWHIQFSRVGFEANVALFFIVLGSLFLLKNIHRFTPSILISSVAFAIAFYFYRSVYVFLPPFLLGCIIIYRTEIFKQLKNKYLWVSILVFLLIFLPFFPSMISNKGMVRAKQTSVFTVMYEELSQAAMFRQRIGDPVWAQVLLNRRVVFGEKIITNYVSHFTPKFLFIEGDSNARHRTFDFGQLYLWEAPFLLLGIYFLFMLPKKIRYFILLWILVAPLAASVSIPAPHALRSLNMLPMPQILVAFGLFYTFYFLRSSWRKAFVLLVLVFVCTSFYKYAQSYRYTNIAIAKEWADGYKQLALYIFEHEHKYDRVIITGHYWQPYEYMLFYKKYDPKKFQESGSNKAFDKYLFGGTEWDNGTELDAVNLRSMAKTKKILVALSPNEYLSQKSHVAKLTEIRDHSNELLFIVGEVR